MLSFYNTNFIFWGDRTDVTAERKTVQLALLISGSMSADTSVNPGIVYLMSSNEAYLAELSVRPPRKLFIFYIKTCIYRINVSNLRYLKVRMYPLWQSCTHSLLSFLGEKDNASQALDLPS